MKKLEWVAGFIEGEGSFVFNRNTLNVSVSQVQKWPLEKLSEILGGKVYRCNNKYGGYFMWCANGVRAAAISMTLYALMSPKRKEQIRKVLGLWRRVPPRGEHWTHCKNGHLFTDVNNVPAFKKIGLRRCRICRNQYARNWRRKAHSNF